MDAERGEGRSALRRRVRRSAVRACVGIGVLAMMLASGGCEDNQAEEPKAPAVIAKGGPDTGSGVGKKPTKTVVPGPRYSDVAKAYNERLEVLERFRARVNVRLRYRDAEGEWKEEQPEGLLQVIRPDRVAMSLGKAGKTLFWFGCDAERYWWFDLDAKPARVQAGVRTADGRAAREQLGISIAPWDLVALLGVIPLDVKEKAKTEWNVDRSQIGVTVSLGKGRGAQRIWMGAKDYFPVRIELFTDENEFVAFSELSGDERAEITRIPVGGRPRMPATVNIRPTEGEAQIRLSLTAVTDARISEESFDYGKLLAHFQISPENVHEIGAAESGEDTSEEK